MHVVGGQRWRDAVRAVADVERTSDVLPRAVLPSLRRVEGRLAWRRGADLSAVPIAVRPAGRGRLIGLPAPVAADLIAVAKFDVQEEVKVRAFYSARRCATRIEQWLEGEANGVERTFEAHEQVQKHVSGLMPRVEDSGVSRSGRLVYIVEEMVNGRQPTTWSELQEVAEDVSARLHRLHLGVGVTSRRLSELVSGRLMSRWQAFVDRFEQARPLDGAVRRLVERDDLLEVSLGHGDLVPSNIIVSEGGVTLLDWEFSRERAIAFDVAKLHLHGADLDRTRVAIERGLDYSVGSRPGHYSFAEQLALAHVQTLTWYKAQLVRATRANRSKALRIQTERRLAAVSGLLGVELASAGG